MSKTLTFGVILLLSLHGCVNERSKDKLFGKNEICKGIYREKYIVFSGGALSAELYSDYLTDSVNFRIYVGTHDQEHNFDYECRGDSITVEKFSTSENDSQTSDKKIYKISELRRMKLFD